MSLKNAQEILCINNLVVDYLVDGTVINALNGVSIKVYEDECVAIVGESGSGKSTLALSILRLLPFHARVREGEIIFESKNLLLSSEDEMSEIRGKKISMIFQEPISYLNPVYTIGDQMMETIKTHDHSVTDAEAYNTAMQWLKWVGIPDPERVMKMYQFQLSGGMAQRALIVLALLPRPKLLIADEPTSALDLTTQALILKLLKKIKQELKISLMLITHDLGVVSYLADRVYVIYKGTIVDEGLLHDLFREPKHPYSKMLLSIFYNLSGLNERLTEGGLRV